MKRLIGMLSILLAAVAALVLVGAPAQAATFADAATDPVVTFNVDWVVVLQFVVATLLPLLVAVVTTKVTSSKVKGILLAVFALATTVLTSLLNALVSGEPTDLGAVLSSALGTFAWAVVSYFGIWRAEGKDGAPSVADAVTANVGRKAPASISDRLNDSA